MAALTYCYGTESGHSAGCQDHGTEYVGDLTRFQQPRGNGVSYTVDDAGNVTSQAYDGKAAATTHYAAGGHGLPDYAVDEVGDKTTYADYDANGLPRTVTDPRGNTGTTDPETSGIWRYDYDAVGNLLAVTDPRGTGVPETALSGDAKDNPFRFEGFELDNGVATYDMQARPYRPDLGRFTTPDRFEDSLGDFALQSDPLTQNRYAFGAGNPVNDVEFDGHCAPSTGSTLYGPCRALPGTPKRTAQRVNRRADAAGRRIDARNAAATRVAQHAQQVATTVARKVNFHYCQQGEDCSRQDTTQNVARLRAALVLGTDLRQVRLHRSYTPNASSPWLDLTLLTGGIAGDLVKGGAAAVASIFARGAAEGGAMAAAQACVRACKAAAKVLVRGRSKAAGDVSPTVGELRAAGQAEAHHVIQDAAVRDVLGYNTNEAPGIQLEGPSTEIGSPHYAATQVQRSAEVGGTYGAERQVACAALAAAGCSRGQIADALARADEYFMRRLDLTFESPLRIPGNRRIP